MMFRVANEGHSEEDFCFKNYVAIFDSFGHAEASSGRQQISLEPH